MYSEIFLTNNCFIPDNHSFDNINLRAAVPSDLEFIIESIIESEKSGSQIISTCNVFGFSEVEYKEILREILLEDINYCEYGLSGFLIAEYNGECVGTYASWIEGLGGISSGILKASILTPFLNKEKVEEMQRNKLFITALALRREVGALQLEYLYVKNNFRRRGLSSLLIKESIKCNLNRYSFTKVQTILFKDNIPSYCTHLKLGFEVTEEKSADNKNVLKYFPYSSRVLMELYYEKIQRLQ